MRSREFPGSKIQDWKREVKMREFMQRRNGMWQMGKRRRRRRWRRKGGDASHSWVSQGNWMEVVVGGLLFQLGESNHLISSNCNESILSGEERWQHDGQGNGSGGKWKWKKSKIRRLKEGKQEFQTDNRRLEKSSIQRMQMPGSCPTDTDTLRVSEEPHTHIRATRQKHELKTKWPDKWGKGKKTSQMWRWLEAKVMEGPSSACGRITRL